MRLTRCAGSPPRLRRACRWARWPPPPPDGWELGFAGVAAVRIAGRLRRPPRRTRQSWWGVGLESVVAGAGAGGCGCGCGWGGVGVRGAPLASSGAPSDRALVRRGRVLRSPRCTRKSWCRCRCRCPVAAGGVGLRVLRCALQAAACRPMAPVARLSGSHARRLRGRLPAAIAPYVAELLRVAVWAVGFLRRVPACGPRPHLPLPRRRLVGALACSPVARRLAAASPRPSALASLAFPASRSSSPRRGTRGDVRLAAFPCQKSALGCLATATLAETRRDEPRRAETSRDEPRATKRRAPPVATSRPQAPPFPPRGRDPSVAAAYFAATSPLKTAVSGSSVMSSP